MLTNVTLKRRKSWLLAASALASSSLGISGPVLAVDECGLLDASGSVTCTSASNPYPNGITYGPPPPGPATQLHVTLDSNVNVVLAAPGIGVALNNFGNSVPVLLSANGATINVTSVPLSSGGNRGLYVETKVGNATITASGQIDVAGEGGGNHAIKAFVNGAGPGNASVTYNGPGLSSSGTNSTVIQAESLNGSASIDASGNISGHVTSHQSSENTFVGLFAQTGPNPGDASVMYRSGTINVQGKASNGIFAGAEIGTAQITTLPGTTIIVSGTNPGESTPTQTVTAGIDAEIFSGPAALGSAITVNAASTINMFGTVTPNASIFGNPVGIRALSKAVTDSAPIVVNYTGPGITTQGGGGIGILALGNGGGGSGVNSGGVTVASSGPITTNGTEALGIVADSGTVYNVTHSRPQLGPGGNVSVTSSGAITTQGAEAHGIWAASTTGTVLVNATKNVSTTGQFSTGINAISLGVPATATPGGNVAVNVAQGVSVMGGWQAGVTGVGSSTLFALPAAGVILSSTGGTATLTNDGIIGALSDRAVAGDPQVINNNTITGFVQFTGGNNSILNNGTFNLRHFADTNGDGVRDTVRVAVADLGTGPGNSFTNIGTLALLGAPGATTLDATGQYLPLGLTFNAMALGGPVHGQILGAATFTNSGTINLQANPVPGDVLLISGGHTPGSNGGGKFISGGSLLIDTVLNEGGTASRSDVLVLDNAVVGAGATGISVHIAGGPGALTPGNGILVVQGLGITDPGAFRLTTSSLEAGAFSYLLFHGSVDASGPQNFYLRSTLTCSVTPEAPGCVTPPTPIPPTPTPPQPVIPNFRPAVPLYTAVSPLATQYGFSSLGTLHERMGDPYAMVAPAGGAPVAPAAPAVYLKAMPAAAPATDFPAIWGRLLGEVGKRDNNNFLSAGPDYTWNFGGLQSGFDLWRREGHDGARDHAGVYGTFGAIGADVQRVFRELGPSAGTISMNAVSFGGYWTHYGSTGWYVDAVTQGTWYDSDARSATGPALHTNGLGWAGSLEGGYPIALAGRLVLEPQAQLIYQRVRFNDGNDGDALVSFDNSDALQGRLGARLVKTWDVGAPTQPRPLDTWLRANLWHEFLNGTDTTFAGLTGANAITFAAPLKGTWAEIGGGATGAIGPNTTLFATTAYQHNIDGNHQFAWTGRAGVTVRW